MSTASYLQEDISKKIGVLWLVWIDQWDWLTWFCVVIIVQVVDTPQTIHLTFWCITHTYFVHAGSDRTLVMVETKRNADFLTSFLSQEGYPTSSIHRYGLYIVASYTSWMFIQRLLLIMINIWIKSSKTTILFSILASLFNGLSLLFLLVVLRIVLT